MNINIRGDKIKVTDAIKSYTEEKINKLSKYFKNSKDINASVLIKIKGKTQTIEVTIPTGQFILRAEESNDDLYCAIDFVLEKLESQIRKNKTKITNKISKEVNTYFDYTDIEEDELTENKIVKRKIVSSKPMSEEEAIMQMNLLSHAFFVFKNEDTDNISILYKRKDDDYGIIDVE